MTLAAPELLVAGGLVVCDGRAARLNDFGAFPWISLLRAREVLVFANKEADDFLDELLRLPRQPRLELPDELKFDLVSARPKPSLVIKAGKRDPWGRNFVAGELSFDYDGGAIAANLTGRNVFQRERRRVIQRDPQTENAAKARLEQLGFRDGAGARDAQLELPAERVPKVVRALTQEGWRVEADGRLYRSAGALRMEGRCGVDWFDLDGGAEFGESGVSLPKLLRAIKHGEHSVRLDDGHSHHSEEGWSSTACSPARQRQRDQLRFSGRKQDYSTPCSPTSPKCASMRCSSACAASFASLPASKPPILRRTFAASCAVTSARVGLA